MTRGRILENFPPRPDPDDDDSWRLVAVLLDPRDGEVVWYWEREVPRG